MSHQRSHYQRSNARTSWKRGASIQRGPKLSGPPVRRSWKRSRDAAPPQNGENHIPEQQKRDKEESSASLPVLKFSKGHKPKRTTLVNNSDNTSTVCKFSKVVKPKKTKHAKPMVHRPVAKRIKLDEGIKDLPDSCIETDNPPPGKEQDDQATINKTLSDFRYRSTQNRLVRVQQRETAICPMYLRGEGCTRRTCRLRHDVSLESARPVCRFFLQEGMCTRDDCPFRHVKVSDFADVCPRFTRLGYCDDESCVLLHERKGKKERKMTYTRTEGP